MEKEIRQDSNVDQKVQNKLSKPQITKPEVKQQEKIVIEIKPIIHPPKK